MNDETLNATRETAVATDPASDKPKESVGTGLFQAISDGLKSLIDTIGSISDYKATYEGFAKWNRFAPLAAKIGRAAKRLFQIVYGVGNKIPVVREAIRTVESWLSGSQSGRALKRGLGPAAMFLNCYFMARDIYDVIKKIVKIYYAEKIYNDVPDDPSIQWWAERRKKYTSRWGFLYFLADLLPTVEKVFFYVFTFGQLWAGFVWAALFLIRHLIAYVKSHSDVGIDDIDFDVDPMPIATLDPARQAGVAPKLATARNHRPAGTGVPGRHAAAETRAASGGAPADRSYPESPFSQRIADARRNAATPLAQGV